MRKALIGLILLPSLAMADIGEQMYQGTWLTTNRRLDGFLTCVVTDLGGNKWRGYFSGTWQGREFSYKVDFKGTPEKLRGQAVIDGADYEWTGEMTRGQFNGKFWGSRYRGSFSMKQKTK